MSRGAIAPPRPHPSRQRGIALISVLLVFALATVIASEIIARNALDIRKTANYLNSQQAYYYALSGEAYGRQLLYRDFSETAGNTPSDGLADDWARLKQGFDIDNGSMTITIVDLQGRFNINSLRTTQGTIDAGARNTLSALLRELGIRRDYAPVLVDWLDADELPVKAGAEDSGYSALGYLPANALLADISELRLLQDFAAEDYEYLRGHVVALPAAIENRARTYNINTLDAKLIKALVPSIAAPELERIEAIQQRGGYTTVAAWVEASSALAAVAGQLGVSSEFFEITVTVKFAGRSARLVTQVQRVAKDGDIRVLKRQQLPD